MFAFIDQAIGIVSGFSMMPQEDSCVQLQVQEQQQQPTRSRFRGLSWDKKYQRLVQVNGLVSPRRGSAVAEASTAHADTQMTVSCCVPASDHLVGESDCIGTGVRGMLVSLIPSPG